MKHIDKILVLFLFTLGMASCVENENFEILPKEEKLAIRTPGDGSVIVLDDTNPTNTGLFLSWSSSDSSSEHDYVIEAATTGTDFEAPVTMGTTQLTYFGMSVEELNTFLLDEMGLDPDDAVSLDIRVSTGSEVSEKIALILTPYTVEYKELFLVGSMTGPWEPAESLPMTMLDFNVFEITVDLADGDEFKFLPTNTGWDNDLGEDPDNPGHIIKEGEQNISGYAAGKYKITADLNTFTFVVDEVLAPEELYLVGNLTGWDPATSLPFFNSGENVFTIVADLPEGAEFKFLPTNTGWEGDWGEDPNNPGDLNNPGSIIQEGEQNVAGFAAGKYLITVDFNTLTYKLSAIDNLFLVGSLTGWDPATSLPMGEPALGVFSIVIDLPDGAEFKFLPTNTGWDGDWGEDASNPGRIIQDGEDNVKGYAAGKYVIAVDFNTLSFTVSAVSEVPANLYLVGSFNGWSNDANNPQFTEASPGVFEITQALSAGDEFKFVPVAGDWGNDWGESKVSSKVLEQNDEKNVAVSEAGTYKITVDFNLGSITIM